MNAIFFPLPPVAGTISLPAVRGRANVNHSVALFRQPLATDPIGTFALTLNNVVVGSAIQIEAQDGSAVLHNSVAASTSVVISLSAYAAGSPLNNLRIKVRKGSVSPFFQPYETLATALVGAQAIFVSQTPDE